MSSYKIELSWQRTTPDFNYDHFNRDHSLKFSGDQALRNSSAPEYLGNTDTANPEELIASALSSCHMLTFLAVASKMGYTVDSYTDHAEAFLNKNEEGRLAVTEINLSPVIVFSGTKIPDADQLKSLHEKATETALLLTLLKRK